MSSYEFLVKKTLIGTFTVKADTEDEARAKVKDHALRIISVNNRSPWSMEIVHENLLDTTEGVE